MPKYKVGIIGCGSILLGHIEAIKQNATNFQLVALCDTNKTILQKQKKLYNVRGFVNYREMLSE